jgi:hypothetical protein
VQPASSLDSSGDPVEHAEMASWSAFASERPELAAAGRELLYQHGVGLAFLATVRADGGPRLHPMCPLLREEGLFAFIVPSPKQRDLHRDGRYAMHSFPCESNEDAFYSSGRATPIDDGPLRRELCDQFVTERAALGVTAPAAHDELFGFELDTCLLTRTSGHGDLAPVHTVWREGRAATSR